MVKNTTVAKFATVQKEGGRATSRDIEYFNLDVIIAVGYRVNSKQGTQFRQWATRVLKDHLIQGYTYYEKRLQEKGLTALEDTLSLLQKTLTNQQLVNDLGTEAISLVTRYAKTWRLLLAYDENRLVATGSHTSPNKQLSYEDAKSAITALKERLQAHQEATNLFGQEREFALSSILGNLEQTFGGEVLYPTLEEKAAHLLYFTIKDHPFSDGNKRIASFLFLLYLEIQNLPIHINDNGLVALALLIAESAPSQKELMINLVTHLLTDHPRGT